jgi:hypothetical protein
MIRHRKLVLRAETVRVLGSVEMSAAHGGISGDFCIESTGVPCITFSCPMTGDLSRATPCGYTYQVGDCETSVSYPPA